MEGNKAAEAPVEGGAVVASAQQSKKNKRKERRDKQKQKQKERNAAFNQSLASTQAKQPALFGEVTNTGWEALNPPLSDVCLLTLKRMGFFKTTPVQQVTIPLFLTHKDVAVEVQNFIAHSGYYVNTLARLVRDLVKPYPLSFPSSKS